MAAGGPGKAPNMEKIQANGATKFDNDMNGLKAAADAQGVKAQAHFTADTPPKVIERSKVLLGADNVKVYAEPPLKDPAIPSKKP